MGVLAWLGVPAAATLLAIVWVNWAARPRGPIETEESLAERERFKAAFDRQTAEVDAASPEQAARRAS